MMEAREAIAEIYETFEKAFHTGDADAISLVYTEDAEWIVPQAPIVQGRKAIAQAWKGIIGAGGNSLRIETFEVQESGDWAYEVGRFEAVRQMARSSTPANTSLSGSDRLPESGKLTATSSIGRSHRPSWRNIPITLIDPGRQWTQPAHSNSTLGPFQGGLRRHTVGWLAAGT